MTFKVSRMGLIFFCGAGSEDGKSRQGLGERLTVHNPMMFPDSLLEYDSVQRRYFVRYFHSSKRLSEPNRFINLCAKIQNANHCPITTAKNKVQLLLPSIPSYSLKYMRSHRSRNNPPDGSRSPANKILKRRCIRDITSSKIYGHAFLDITSFVVHSSSIGWGW